MNIDYRKLQVDRMMPIHGKLTTCPYDKFLEADMLLSSMLSAQD